MQKPTRVDQEQIALARWDDPARGSVMWKTLMSGEITQTDSMVCGIAQMSKGDNFALHSHPQSEIYFGLEGCVEVQINDQIFALSPGVALFIPGGAVHGVPKAQEPVRWFYTFAADRFDQIDYSFIPAAS
jgi:quercetin dioxygenase-like cupin family protein